MRRAVVSVFLTVLATAAWGQSAQALWWQGTGNWSDPLWATSELGEYNSSWVSGSDAVFQDVAGTITADIATSVGNITFYVNETIAGGSTLTLSGTPTITVYPNVVGTASASLAGDAAVTKVGSGTLVLSGNNSYTGLTTISEGVLRVQSNSALGTNSAGTTVASNAALQLQGGVTITGEALSITGSGTTDVGALRSISGNNQWAGPITMGSSEVNRIYCAADTLTLSGNISLTGAGINNQLLLMGAGRTAITGNISGGASGITTLTLNATGGTVTLSGNNSYLGVTNVYKGTLNVQSNTALGSASDGTTVAAGNTLELQGGVTVAGESLSLAGSGVSDVGALRNVSGNNEWTGPITMNSSQANRIVSDSGVLKLSGDISLTGSGRDLQLLLMGAGNTVISGNISGGASGYKTLSINGTGVRTLSGANSYLGVTEVVKGTLIVQNNMGLGSAVDGTTVAKDTALQLQGGVTITGEALSITGSGTTTELGALRSISGNNQWAGPITMGSSEPNRIYCAADTLTLSGNISLTGAGINNQLLLMGPGRTAITGNISGGASGITTLTLNASGGTVTLSGNNSYLGVTNVYKGTLNVQSNTALGSASDGTTVAAGNTLELQGGVTVAGESLSLAGSGVSDVGALRNVSGNNEWTGPITMDSSQANRIVSDSGVLKLSGGISLTGSGRDYQLIVAGAGDTVISGSITGGGAGYSTFMKSGTGKLVLAGNNSYAGNTELFSGVLQIGNGGTSGTVGTGEIINKSSLVFNRSDDYSVSNVISDVGSVTKAGAGTLTLSGVNTYTGGTTVDAGMLNVTGSLAEFGDSDILIQSAGTTFGANDPRIALLVSGGADLGDAPVGSTIKNGAYNTNGTLLDGTFSENRTVTMAWRQMNAGETTLEGGGLVSDVLKLDGTGSDMYVLQMSYSETAIESLLGSLTNESGVTLAWLDGQGNWVNAVLGNTGGTATFINGAYNPTTDFVLGYYGIDTENNAVWAVVNHNSQFAAMVTIPEPGTVSLLTMGLLSMLACAWRRRKR